MRSIQKISIIGSGNVATHLGLALRKKGLTIDSVFSRKISRAKKLAQQLKADATNKLSKVSPDSHLYIIAVSDDVIADVALKLEQVISPDAIISHTSGSVTSEVLRRNNSGVFYPLQSFTIKRKIDFKEVPFCIHSKDSKVEKKLIALARKLSKAVYKIDDEARGVLHIGAVFSANFSNHMYHIASEICEQYNVNFDILKPLILEIAKKIQTNSPHDMQTGPARRKDQKTIDKHLKQLSDNITYKKTYKLITESIKSNYE